MNLGEVQNCVNNLMERGYEDASVVITIDDIGIGARACSEISSISCGFDWEQGQIRIEPSKKLISKEKDRDKALPVVKISFEENYRSILSCPKCENHLKKTDEYCSRCGQRVDTKSIKKEIIKRK